MPVDRSQLNAVGDVVVTHAEALRALADPVSLRLFDLVKRLGPATTSELASAIGEAEEPIRARLTAMEAANLIDLDDDGRSVWSTPASGIYFEIPETGEETQQAARTLSNVMFAAAAELPPRWIDDAEQKLSVEWARAAGLFNARVDVTPDELRELQDSLERLLEPFTNRAAAKRPADTSTVRILAFFMPEPAAPDGPS